MARVISVLQRAHSIATVSRKLISGIAAVVLLLGLATTASAQQSSGSIRGTVDGADSATVVEVVDTTRGITKSEGTESDGSFRFDGLTPGTYEVRVLAGGQVVDTHVAKVRLGATTTLSMATTAEAIEEIVTTGKRIKAIDTSIAESGLVIDAETLLELPVMRDLSSVAMLAPGVTRGDYRFGGAGGKNDGIVSFAGASIAENTSFVNGLNLTNFRTGVGFSQVPFEFYETLQVKTGGYSAKYGRSLGGVMNARTKSGSNEFHAGVNMYYEKQMDESPETYLAANKQDAEDETNYDVFVSGPIWKDHLFFYALYSDNNLDKTYAGNTSERGFDYSVDQGFWGVKLDAYITDNHHLELTAFSDEREGIEANFGFDPSTGSFGAYLGDTVYNEGGKNWIATYTGDFTDNLSISVSYGENEANRTTDSATGHLPVVYEYQDGFVAVGDWTSFNIEVGDDKREMSRVDINWQVGRDHSLTFGIDNETNTADNFTINSGGVYWLRDPTNDYNACTPAECPSGANVRRRTYASGGSFETSSNAFYIQDVWEVSDNLTLELGLRNESFENLNGEGNVFVKVDNQLAPRLAVVWDPSGEGTSKFFANYGLYYLPIAANTNIRMSGGEVYIHEYFDWDGTSVDAEEVPTGLPSSPYNTIVYGNGEVPDTRSVTDNNIEPMYQSEIILGYTRFLDSGSSVGIKGIYRNLETTIEDVAIDAAVNTYYAGNWDTSVNAGDAFDPLNPTTTGCGDDGDGNSTRDCNSMDYFTGFHQYVLTNPGNAMSVYIPEQGETILLSTAELGYPLAERQYVAFELNYDRPFDGQFGMNLSYTWAHSWGNHEGYVQSDIGQDDAGITQNFDQPGMTDFSYGNLPNDRRHTIKGYGTYQLDNGLRFGAGIMWQSGRPKSCFGVHPTDVFAAAYGAFSFYCDQDGPDMVPGTGEPFVTDPDTGELVPDDVAVYIGTPSGRGKAGRTPDILNVDMNVQYTMDLGGTDVLLSLDMFNVFNSQNATVINEIAETFSGTPDVNYNKIRQYQQPRWLRLSARVRF